MNVNQVNLAGRLTRNPDLKFIPSGTAVVNFGLAVNRVYGSGENRKEETTFVDCVAWAKAGETIAKFLKKGDPIYISGRLTFEQWEQQDGTKRSKLKVTVNEFQFIGGKSEATPGAQAAAAVATTLPSESNNIPF